VCKDMMRTIDTGKSPTRLLEFTYQVRTAHVCMLHTKAPSVNRSTTPSCDQRAGAPAGCLARPPTHRSAAARLDRNVVWPQSDMISTAPKRSAADACLWPSV
jgi:hypothetical protein